MKKATNDVKLILVFAWLLTLWLLHAGAEPTVSEALTLIAALVAVVAVVLLRAARAEERKQVR